MRRRVSGAQPTVKDHFEESGSVLEKEVMVRQVPFMEIEAPSSASGRMVGQEVIVRVVPEVAPAEGSDGVRFDIAGDCQETIAFVRCTVLRRCLRSWWAGRAHGGGCGC